MCCTPHSSSPLLSKGHLRERTSHLCRDISPPQEPVGKCSSPQCHDIVSLPLSWDRGQCQHGSSKAARSCTGRATASISRGAILRLLQKTGMVRCLIKYVPPSAGALQQP